MPSGGGQPQALCLHARVSPGVYAFGFLFMLPQLFVNYKVRGAPSPVSPTPLGHPALMHPISLSPDEVSGPPALEGLHLQGQCVACTSPLGPGPQPGHVSAVLRGGALGALRGSASSTKPAVALEARGPCPKPHRRSPERRPCCFLAPRSLRRADALGPSVWGAAPCPPGGGSSGPGPGRQGLPGHVQRLAPRDPPVTVN